MVIEEITSEPRTEPTSDPVDEPYAEQITIITTEENIEELKTQGESQDENTLEK